MSEDVHAVAGLPQLANMHANMGITLMVSMPCRQPRLLLIACTVLQTSGSVPLATSDKLSYHCRAIAVLLQISFLLSYYC